MRKDSGIKVIGSLNPQKEVQDRVRVLSFGGSCQSLRATDYKDPPKVLVLVQEKSNENTDMFVDSE
jgi:hypothetical protein